MESFALLCLLVETMAVLLHFTVFIENMAVLLHLSIISNCSTFFVPHLLAESLDSFDALFIFAERIFWVTLRSYWRWGKFLSMVRSWLKLWKFSLTLHSCCWKFLWNNLGLVANYSGCIKFVIAYFHTFESKVSYVWFGNLFLRKYLLESTFMREWRSTNYESACKVIKWIRHE